MPSLQAGVFFIETFSFYITKKEEFPYRGKNSIDSTIILGGNIHGF